MLFVKYLKIRCKAAIASVENYQFVRSVPALSHPWYFDTLAGVAIDGSGNVYLVDEFLNRIQKFDASGKFITKLGSYGTKSDEFNSPGGMAVGADRQILVDSRNHRIQEFAPSKVNEAPEINSGVLAVTVDEGSEATATGTYHDADGDTLVLAASAGTVTDNGGGTWTWKYMPTDGPKDSQTVTITADDGQDGKAATSFGLMVNNIAPVITSVSAPANPVQAGTNVNVSASFVDPGTGDVHTVTIDWGDGTLSNGVVLNGIISGAHIYNLSGVYTVKVAVMDQDGGYAESFYSQYVVIFEQFSRLYNRWWLDKFTCGSIYP
ncbi:MAG: PKD domain-containing protein [Bacillota bacterium]